MPYTWCKWPICNIFLFWNAPSKHLSIHVQLTKSTWSKTKSLKLMLTACNCIRRSFFSCIMVTCISSSSFLRLSSFSRFTLHSPNSFSRTSNSLAASAVFSKGLILNISFIHSQLAIPKYALRLDWMMRHACLLSRNNAYIFQTICLYVLQRKICLLQVVKTQIVSLAVITPRRVNHLHAIM